MDALGINLSGLITQLVSFIILFLILKKVLFGPINKILQTRAKKIQESLEMAESVKQEATESAERLESEINKARQEGQKLIGDARDAAEKYKQQEILRTTSESEEMIKKANKSIEKERDLAIQSVRKEFSSLVISAASKVVEKTIDQKDHKEILDKAIVELAIENNNSSTWVNNFDDAHTFLSNRDLFAFLTSPQVPQMEKFKSIDTLMKEYDKLFKNFIKVLISRNQINLFQNIKEDFIRQFQSSTGKISAIISSAVKISDTQRKLIIENICKIFDVNEVDVKEKIDQKILGGLIINVGDTVIDISTSNKLENLKKHLLKTSTL